MTQRRDRRREVVTAEIGSFGYEGLYGGVGVTFFGLWVKGRVGEGI